MEYAIDFKELEKPLDISDVDFRIQSINKGGYATILAYKDARADIRRLNKVVGHHNWKREHTRDNKNCIVSIWDAEKQQWVGKEDTGTESATEKEKGLASDSFKRSCFNWGIGSELYDYPLISIKLQKGIEWDLVSERPKQLFGLKLKEWAWFVEFNELGKLVRLGCRDSKKEVRFNFKAQ